MGTTRTESLPGPVSTANSAPTFSTRARGHDVHSVAEPRVDTSTELPSSASIHSGQRSNPPAGSASTRTGKSMRARGGPLATNVVYGRA